MRKKHKIKKQCSVCKSTPITGFGFCYNCYHRLKARINAKFKKQGINPKDPPDRWKKEMEIFQKQAESGDIDPLKAKKANPCLKCRYKKSNSRGLCQACYAKYQRKIRNGKTSWAKLEYQKKCLPANKDLPFLRNRSKKPLIDNSEYEEIMNLN